MKHFKTALLIMTALGLAGLTVSLSFALEDIAGPTIIIHSTGWDATKSSFQITGTATFSDGRIDQVEYFLNDGDIPGAGVPVAGSGRSPLTFTFSIAESALKSGDNHICVHALSSTSVWGIRTCLTISK